MTGKEALLIVDVQNDFCPGGSLAIKEGNQVVPPLNELSRFIRERGGIVFASRDWHPKQTRHFSTGGGVWPVHCVQNTEGGAFHPHLNLDGAIIISKGMDPEDDAYSPFQGKTDQEETLDGLLVGVDTLYIGGLATDYCVKAAVLDARKKGITTVLVYDACRAVELNAGDEQKALDEMTTAGAEIRFSQFIMGKYRTDAYHQYSQDAPL